MRPIEGRIDFNRIQDLRVALEVAAFTTNPVAAA
jgi:hypothetical protein